MAFKPVTTTIPNTNKQLKGVTQYSNSRNSFFALHDNNGNDFIQHLAENSKKPWGIKDRFYYRDADSSDWWWIEGDAKNGYSLGNDRSKTYQGVFKHRLASTMRYDRSIISDFLNSVVPILEKQGIKKQTFITDNNYIFTLEYDEKKKKYGILTIDSRNWDNVTSNADIVNDTFYDYLRRANGQDYDSNFTDFAKDLFDLNKLKQKEHQTQSRVSNATALLQPKNQQELNERHKQFKNIKKYDELEESGLTTEEIYQKHRLKKDADGFVTADKTISEQQNARKEMFDKYYNDWFSPDQQDTSGHKALKNEQELLLKEAYNKEMIAEALMQQEAMRQATNIKNITDAIRSERLAQLRAGMNEAQLADREITMLMNSTDALNKQAIAMNKERILANAERSTAYERAYRNYLEQLSKMGQIGSAFSAAKAGDVIQQTKDLHDIYREGIIDKEQFDEAFNKLTARQEQQNK